MQKRYVCLWFPYLLTDMFERKDASLQNKSFVVCTQQRGKQIIHAANAIAVSKGISTGMSLADARAFDPQIVKSDEKPGIADTLLQRMAEWCIRFSPSVSVDLPEGIIWDATGCAHLWGGEKGYANEILRRFKEKGFYCKLGMADTIGSAWAAARYRFTRDVNMSDVMMSDVKTSANLCIIESGRHTEAMRNWPPEALRIEEEVSARLHQLGLHTTGELLKMPAKALRRRFGTQIVIRLQQAVGSSEEYIVPIHAHEIYSERLPCLDPILRIEGIQIACEHLLQRLCERLQKEGKGVRQLRLRCYKTDNTITETSISTNAASNHCTHLLKLFQLQLGSLHPEPGIELFVMDVLQEQDVQSIQHAIWKEAGGLHDTRFTELIDRLAGKFGSEVIHRYVPAEHYWPERSFVKAHTLDAAVTAKWICDRPRPIILLPEPERIEVTAPIPDYPPMLFRYKSVLHKIIKADGPERIEQEWWIQEGKHRDYYTVEDENGFRYWLFRSGHYGEEPEWMIHGFF